MKTNLRDIILVQTSFERTNEIDFEKNFDVETETNINYGLTPEDILIVNFQYSLRLVVKNATTGEKNNQVQFMSTHVAQFDLDADAKSEEDFENKMERFANINAAAIVFPFVRENAATITAKAGMSPIMIPVTNFIKLYEEKKK